MRKRHFLPGCCIILIGSIAVSTGAAKAACFEAVGCTHLDRFEKRQLAGVSCLNLRFLRNSIYAENGYCFRSREYEDVFGNEACRFKSAEDVPLTPTERGNVLAIVHAEKAKSCRD